MFRHRLLVALFAIVTALVLVAADAHARAGGGSSGGSRGSRTFTAPPATRTAPNTAAPLDRTMTQPTKPAVAGQAAATRPGFFGNGLFGGGLLGGLAAGFIGAGLFGLLFGHGLFGGMGGLASIFGLILQIGLIVIVARLAMQWWQRRSAPAYAGAATPPPAHEPTRFERSGFFGAGGGTPEAAPLTLEKSDFDVFEGLLSEVQIAYGAQNIATLRTKVTPEMLSYFSEEMSKNASRGVVNEVSNVKLLQGDLAEAWREDSVDYATVAMHFSLDDRTIETASGRIVESGPQEVTELWTFMRQQGSDWLLSAIQQA